MKYVALLRGIAPMNPNMRNEKLREVFEGLGFEDVKTVISSGNVVFASPETDAGTLEALIEKALPAKLGFESTTIIRSQAQLQELADLRPFGDREHTPMHNLNVTFLKDRSRAIPLSPRREVRGYQLLGMHDGAVFTVVDITSEKTPNLMAWLERQLGKQITTRTWKTVQRILSIMK